MFQLSSECRHAWLKAISREDLNGKKLNNVFVCGKHFKRLTMFCPICVLIWNAHTRMGQQFVPYEYFHYRFLDAAAINRDNCTY